MNDSSDAPWLQIGVSAEQIRRALQARNLVAIPSQQYQAYKSISGAALVWSQLDQDARLLISPHMAHSKSQLGQDLFALAAKGSLEPGFFVEFGATDGVSLSNTWLLEHKLGWQGILAEPAKHWHAALHSNRYCRIDTRCVLSQNNQILPFLETQGEEQGGPVLSSTKRHANNGDWASDIRLRNSIEYDVTTVTLNSLLDDHQAPEVIDFLSIDTEGSELEILAAYEFTRRRINTICVEHNFQAPRQQIHALLSAQGYQRVHSAISRFDDWYVLS
jgi:FkbM family methyltransferase